jgi:hypothetical protein
VDAAHADEFRDAALSRYTSGHSTFGRAAAEVLTAITGRPFFPDGLAQRRVDS